MNGMIKTILSLILIPLLFACGDKSGAPSDYEDGDALLNPSGPTAEAPAKFRARFKTTKGDFVVESERKWSPQGVDRFHKLIRIGYFNHTPFYRVIPNFVAQFGFQLDRDVNRAWKGATIDAEPVVLSNKRGVISFAQSRPDTRSVHMFVNLKNNGSSLDRQNFPGVARVVEGMKVIDSLYAGYDKHPKQPRQPRMAREGIQHLTDENPKLDYIESASIE